VRETAKVLGFIGGAPEEPGAPPRRDKAGANRSLMKKAPAEGVDAGL